MADAQTLRQVAMARTPFSAWLGVVLLFLMFGLIALAVIGPSPRGNDYEQKRAAGRITKLKAQHEQDHAALTGYAWVDKNKGTVRIPVERAMEITARELSAKKPAAAAPIATPPAGSAAAASGVATPPGAPAPPASPSPPAKIPPSSPPPTGTATPPGSPLPVRGASPGGH